MDTAKAPDKNRKVYVLMLTKKTLTKEAMLAPGWREVVMVLDQTPTEGFRFEYNDCGCHEGQVALIAWAPVPRPRDPLSNGGDPVFNPKDQDYVAVSEIRDPYCGFASDPERFLINLDGTEYGQLIAAQP